jgi:hypothetical protein
VGTLQVIAKPELQAALIIFVARSLEVELLNSLGETPAAPVATYVCPEYRADVYAYVRL